MDAVRGIAVHLISGHSVVQECDCAAEVTSISLLNFTSCVPVELSPHSAALKFDISSNDKNINNTNAAMGPIYTYFLHIQTWLLYV